MSVSSKQEFREKFLAMRRALPMALYREKSDRITERVQALDVFRQATDILCYVASARDKEVDTLPLLRAMFREKRRVWVPVVQPGRRLLWSLLYHLDELSEGRFGILEPKPEFLRPGFPEEPSLCLTPGIVFSYSGERIGYGGGYYDRFLVDYAGVSLGLAFECQVVPALPVTAHDQSVDGVLTEDNLYGAGV